VPTAVVAAAVVVVAAAVAQSFLECHFLKEDEGYIQISREYMEDMNKQDFYSITFLILHLLGNWRVRTSVG